MTLYFTCGQTHIHELDNSEIWDKDSLIQIECNDENQAVAWVFQKFGNEWATWYHSLITVIDFAPKGIVAKIDLTTQGNAT
jgi:hypothetical protein